MPAFGPRIKIIRFVALWIVLTLSACNSGIVAVATEPSTLPPAAVTLRPSSNPTEMLATITTIPTETLAPTPKPTLENTPAPTSRLSFDKDGWMVADGGSLWVWNPREERYDIVGGVAVASTGMVRPEDYHAGAVVDDNGEFAVAYDDQGAPLYVIDTKTGRRAAVTNGVADIFVGSDIISKKTLVWTEITNREDQSTHMELSVILHFKSLDALANAKTPSQEEVNQVLADPTNVWAQDQSGNRIQFGLGQWQKNLISGVQRDIEFLPINGGVPVTVDFTETIPPDFQSYAQQHPEILKAPNKLVTLIFLPTIIGNKFSWLYIGIDGAEYNLVISNYPTQKRAVTFGHFTSYTLTAQKIVQALIVQPHRQIGTTGSRALTLEDMLAWEKGLREKLQDGTLTQEQYNNNIQSIPGAVLRQSVAEAVDNAPGMTYGTAGFELINTVLDLEALVR